MAIRKPKAPLRVVANPFVFLDHEGRPAAAVAFDTGDKLIGQNRRHVGASHSAELIEERAPLTVSIGPDGRPLIQGDGRASRHDVWFEFSPEPQTVPDTLTHRRAMDPSRGGQPALLPADEATAARCGLAFVDPSLVIVETAKVRLAEHVADFGAIPEWAHLHPSLLPAGAVASMEADELHVSHRGHAEFLAAHVAKVKPATPAPAQPPPSRAASARPTPAASEVSA